jgi:predicted Zn-dependent peptidase
MPDVIRTVLPNGVRIVAEPFDTVQTAAIGIWCQTGSRIESDRQAGISHLIEHMLFKGTERRTAQQIAQDIEGRGGYLNAFTNREVTCYYARVLSEDVLVALDVLTDMFLHSLFEVEELEKEKRVILEEIRKYEDSPEELIHDLHAQYRWARHPLGRPVIGTRETVGSFTREDCLEYMGDRYVAGKTVVAIAGYFEPEAFAAAVEERLGALMGDFELPNDPPPVAVGEDHLIEREVEQVHFCIGGNGPSAYDEDRYAMSVLDGILGDGMSSRLFQKIREERGLAYAIGSYRSGYREAGAFTIYGGTSKETFDEVRELVRAELVKLRTEDVPTDELERAKKAIKGSLVMAQEATANRMRRIASNELLFQRDVPIEEVVQRIEAVSAADVRRMAEQYLDPDALSTTAFVPAG